MARILIAEDEEPLRGLVTRALKEDGHEVVATADGAEALDALQREAGGDPEIGRRLMPLLRQAGFAEVSVSPRA